MQGTQQPTFATNKGAADAYYSGARGQNSSKSSSQSGARITAPTTGTIIALDPDIPPSRQRVSLQAQGTGLRWFMDGKLFAKGASAQWLPWPGRHVLQIVGPRGQVLDEVRLEVRGAGVKSLRPALAPSRDPGTASR